MQIRSAPGFPKRLFTAESGCLCVSCEDISGRPKVPEVLVFIAERSDEGAQYIP